MWRFQARLERLTQFLPYLKKKKKKKKKKGSALTCASLDCLSHAFVFFFPRKEESGFESVRQLLIQHSLSEATESKEPFLIIVDEKWKEETCSRVASVITKVTVSDRCFFLFNLSNKRSFATFIELIARFTMKQAFVQAWYLFVGFYSAIVTEESSEKIWR